MKYNQTVVDNRSFALKYTQKDPLYTVKAETTQINSGNISTVSLASFYVCIHDSTRYGSSVDDYTVDT